MEIYNTIEMLCILMDTFDTIHRDDKPESKIYSLAVLDKYRNAIQQIEAGHDPLPIINELDEWLKRPKPEILIQVENSGTSEIDPTYSII